jgi:hypothetical protein
MSNWVDRRAALGLMAGLILGSVSGCQAAAFIIRLPWDRITQVAVNLTQLVITIWGWLDGEEVRTERALTEDEARRFANGEEIVIELKDGTKQTVRPTVQR